MVGSPEPEKILEPALDSSAAPPLPLAQPTAADSVPVIPRDATAERFGGTLTGQNPGEALPKAAPAIPALPFPAFQFQTRMPRSQALVPRLPKPAVLYPQADTPALRARYRSAMPDRYPRLPRPFFNACNLVSRQA